MTNEPRVTEPTPSDVVGERVRELRHRRGQSVAELAADCAAAGHPELTRDAIYTIESGRRLEGRRRRTVSVDELVAFARVFDVPVFELLPEITPSAAQLQEIGEALYRLRPLLLDPAGELEIAGGAKPNPRRKEK